MHKLLLAFVPALALVSTSAQADADWSAVAWMAGCWAGDFGEPGTTEQWMAPAGESMLGMSRTVKKGRTVEHEFLQIRPDAAGRLAYIAKQNQARAEIGRDGFDGLSGRTHNPPPRCSFAPFAAARICARPIVARIDESR